MFGFGGEFLGRSHPVEELRALNEDDSGVLESAEQSAFTRRPSAASARTLLISVVHSVSLSLVGRSDGSLVGRSDCSLIGHSDSHSVGSSLICDSDGR